MFYKLSIWDKPPNTQATEHTHLPLTIQVISDGLIVMKVPHGKKVNQVNDHYKFKSHRNMRLSRAEYETKRLFGRGE